MVTLNTPPDGYHKFENKASDVAQEINQLFTVNIRPTPLPAIISEWFESNAKVAFEEGFKPFLTEEPDLSEC